MKIEIEVSGKIRSFNARRLVCAGYTGRDEEMVKKHILELEKLGVPPPKKVPSFYDIPIGLLTMSEHIFVSGTKTSGEAEYVLLIGKDEILVTVGSDHTDRELEREDVKRSKMVCPKVIARKAWSYNEVETHWDEIEIRSYVDEGGRLRLYQEGKLSFILPPRKLIEKLEGESNGTVLFSGTFPTVGSLSFSNYFKMEMVDPVLKRRISHEYKISYKR